MTESNPDGACRGYIFVLAFEVLAGALCLACAALVWVLGRC